MMVPVVEATGRPVAVGAPPEEVGSASVEAISPEHAVVGRASEEEEESLLAPVEEGTSRVVAEILLELGVVGISLVKVESSLAPVEAEILLGEAASSLELVAEVESSLVLVVAGIF